MLIHDVRDKVHDEREAAIDRRDQAAAAVEREQTAIDALTGALANLDEAIAALDGEAPVAPKVAPTTTPKPPAAPKPAGPNAIRQPAPPRGESQSPKAKAERTREQVVSLLDLAQEPMTIRQLSEATGVAQNSIRRAVDVLLARRQIKGVDLPGVSAAAFEAARPTSAARERTSSTGESSPPAPPARDGSSASSASPAPSPAAGPAAEPEASPSTEPGSSERPSSPTADASDAERRAEEEAAWQEAQQPTPAPFTPLRDELAAAAPPRDALDGLSRLQLWGMVETRGITDVDPDAGEDQLRTIVRADIERAKAELAALDVTDLIDDEDEDEVEDEVEASPPPLPTDALARQILHHLGDGEPDDDAAIARALFRNRLVVSDTLVKLERHGHVRKLPDGRYVKREPVSAS